MVWLKRSLRHPESSSSVTGFPDLLLGLMAWRLVSVRARAVGCLLRCWGGCRGFAQLREGSDDPPPPGGIGASAWADATPRPASRPSRTIVIAKVRRRRETRCMKPKPLHQTPNGIYAACLSKFCLPAPTLHRIAGADGEASRLLDIPRFSPYHPAHKQHTTTSKALEYGEAPPPAICKRTGPHP